MTGSIRSRIVVVTILLVSYGALGARQPAVRTSIPLPVAAAELASALGLDPRDRALLLVSIVRLVFDAPDGSSADDSRRKAVIAERLRAAPRDGQDRVPLPLDTSIWRETLLDRPANDVDITRAILTDRTIALLYHGLAALDDDTLGWLGPERETLLHLRRNAAAFAAFGRSIKVRGGRIAVPGGAGAEPVWTTVIGAEPGRPGAFVQRLFRGSGRLAWFYDTVLHLDPVRQAYVIGGGSDAQRAERLRALLDVFEAAAPEWQLTERPFVRPALDPSLVISLAAVDDRGLLAGPAGRQLWESVFSDDTAPISTSDGLEPSWLARRVSLVPAPIGRRRLETFLFAQRVFGGERSAGADDAVMLAALRGAAAFPALALTLERTGITNASTYAGAARAAAALMAIRSPEWRRAAIAQFQSSLAILDRAVRHGGIERTKADTLVSSLAALPISADRGYGPAFTSWLRAHFVPALPFHAEAADPVEEAVLAACAGVRDAPARPAIVEWEGRRYRADPSAAELRRLRRVRERQRSAVRGTPRARETLDVQLAAAAGAESESARLSAEQGIADTLMSIVYAVHLGEPDGAAAAAGDVAGRHDFGLDALDASKSAAWRLPREEHGDRGGWRITGSVLGLDVALARLAVRRLDFSDMPGEPTLSTSERNASMVTAALFGPLTGDADHDRDRIAEAISRGRARVAGLRGDRAEIDRVADEAGLSEWRREALVWSLAHDRDTALPSFSLVELFWLGTRHRSTSAFQRWGAATTTLDGCLCLQMPGAQPWESRAGRASAGHLSTLGADVPLRVAELLAELKLPASLAPAVVAYAMQDLVDLARPAYFDDWGAVQRVARELPRERLFDYIAALAGDGPLVPIEGAGTRE
jgi:hypothetical protein